MSEQNLPLLTNALRGYLKFTSMLWIRAFRQPTLDGLVIRHWSPDTGPAIQAFCQEHGYRELLLRIDTLNHRWSARRGGYNIPISGARATIRELNQEHRIGALLEPASPYRDLYCLTSVTDEAQENISVEVVGPGFDTSDLLRSDMLPHERFEMALPRLQRGSTKRVAARRRRTYVVSADQYKKTVEERLAKIGARLRNPAYPKTVLDSPTVDRHQLRQEATAFLQRTRQTLLLRHANLYRPIPERFLNKFAIGVGTILDRFGAHHIHLGCTAFSGAFIAHGRFVFWDFFPADRAKAAMLYAAE